MRETITYNLVSTGMLPAWAAVLVWIAATALVLLMLRGELGKRSGKARTPWLYVIRSAMAVLLGILLLQPVLLVRKQIEHPAALPVIADRSRSMLRSDSYSTRELLDLAALIHPEMLSGRQVAASGCAATLQRELPAQEKGRLSIEAISNQLAQGLPWGNSFDETVGGEFARIKELNQKLRGHADRLSSVEAEMRKADSASRGGQKENPGQAAEGQDASAPHPEKPFRTIEGLLKAVAQLEDSLKSSAGRIGNGDEIAAVLQNYRAVSSAWPEAQAAANQIQDRCDAAFWENLQQEARERLSSVSAMNRFSMAESFAKSLLKDAEITGRHEVRMIGWEALDDSNALSETDLFAPLSDAVAATVKEAVGGIVLVSDGCQNLPEDPGVLRRMKARGIPLVAAGVGQRSRQEDVAVLDFRIKRIMLVGAKETARITLKTSVPKDTPVNVSIDAPSGNIARKSFPADGTEKLSAEIEFKVPESSSGVWRISAEPENVKDAAPENNSASFGAAVVPHSLNVLIVAPSPRWDIVQIMDALKGLPCRTDTVFWRALDKEKPVPRGTGQGKIPSSLDQLRKYSLVILDAEPFRGMQPADAALFQDYVRNLGGTILMTSGENGASYMREFHSMTLPQGAPAPSEGGQPLKASAIPDAQERTDGARIEPSPSARLYHAVSLSADGTETLGLWKSFHALSRVYPVPPQDITLLQSGTSSCLSLGFQGRGKLYLMGVGELFRLREWEAQEIVDRFMSSFMEDCLTPLFSGEKDTVATYPDVPVAGAPVHVVSLSAPGKGIVSGGAQDLPLDFAEIKAGGGSSASFHIPQTPGSFTASDPAGQKKAFASVAPISRESTYFSLDSDFLEDLARRGDGAYVPLVSLADAVKALKPITAKDVSFNEIRLWSWPLILILIAILFTVDWILRRKYGLVM